jgi:hypothetical protein
MSPFERRFHFIEVMITWQGRVNASHLIKHFSISRKQASATFTKYVSNHPQSIVYDDTVKGFVADCKFSLIYSVSEFSQYHTLVNHTAQPIFTSIVDVVIPTRNPQPHLAQPILRAIDNKLAIDIGYTSLTSPEYKDRIIEPHSLIFDGLRWHVRAFCRKNMSFRDFVLSRFNGEVINEGKAQHDSSNDHQWHQKITLEIEPDPRLSRPQQQVISDDYQMTNGMLLINTRAALVNYLLKRMHLDKYDEEPSAQQITLTKQCETQISNYRY